MQRTNTWENLLRLTPGPRGVVARQPGRRPPPGRLCLEPLEDRSTPCSYTITAIPQGLAASALNNASVVQVVGTDANYHAWENPHQSHLT
jgi:hypothetical protein